MNINQTIIDEVVDEKGRITKPLDVIKELYVCGFKKADFLDEHGNIIYDKYSEVMIYASKKNSSIIIDALSKCKDVKGDESGETIIKSLNCLIDYGGFP